MVYNKVDLLRGMNQKERDAVIELRKLEETITSQKEAKNVLRVAFNAASNKLARSKKRAPPLRKMVKRAEDRVRYHLRTQEQMKKASTGSEGTVKIKTKMGTVKRGF